MDRHAIIHNIADLIGAALDQLMGMKPHTRYTAMVMTNLEEATMWLEKEHQDVVREEEEAQVPETGLVGKIRQEREENRAGLPAIERQALHDRQMFARVHIPAEQIAAQQERPFIRAIEQKWEAIRQEAVRLRMLQMLEEGRRLQEDTAPHQQGIEDNPPF